MSYLRGCPQPPCGQTDHERIACGVVYIYYTYETHFSVCVKRAGYFSFGGFSTILNRKSGEIQGDFITPTMDRFIHFAIMCV